MSWQQLQDIASTVQIELNVYRITCSPTRTLHWPVHVHHGHSKTTRGHHESNGLLFAIVFAFACACVRAWVRVANASQALSCLRSCLRVCVRVCVCARVAYDNT